jgi:hypothetical protein
MPPRLLTARRGRRLDEWQPAELGLGLEVDVSGHKDHGRGWMLALQLQGGPEDPIVGNRRARPAGSRANVGSSGRLITRSPGLRSTPPTKLPRPRRSLIALPADLAFCRISWFLP